MAEPTTTLVSLVASLEPLAGISLALNLAYLNLQRWRYRQQVRSIAKSGLENLEEAKSDDGSTIAALPQLRGLKVLAGEQVESKKLPYFIDVFEAVYGREWDVRAGVVFSIFSVIILSVGVAHSIGVWEILRWVAGRSFTSAYFYGLLISIACPVASVILGRYLSKKATGYAQDCFDELSSVYAKKIDQVKVPTTPPAANSQSVATQDNTIRLGGGRAVTMEEIREMAEKAAKRMAPPPR